MPLAAPPTNLSYSTNSLNQLVISWFYSANATGYNIYIRSGISDSFTAPANVSPITGNSYIDSGYVSGTAIYINVTSVNASGESLPSATLSYTEIIGPVVPRVDFHQTKFNKFITEKGYRLMRQSALACPCNVANESATNASDLNCPLCKNKHYIYFPAGQMQAICSNMTQENTLEQSGQWLAGMYKITLKPTDQLGLYDRLIFMDDSVSFTEAITRGTSGNVDQLRFPAISFDLPIEDINGVIYLFGTDFTIDANGDIVWGISNKQPSPGTFYGVRYQMLKRVLVVDAPHVQRASFLGPNYEAMSLAAIAKLEFFIE